MYAYSKYVFSWKPELVNVESVNSFVMKLEKILYSVKSKKELVCKIPYILAIGTNKINITLLCFTVIDLLHSIA